MLSRSTSIKILLLVITLAGLYFSMRVELGEDALDMLPGDTLRGDFSLLQQMGMVNRIFISLENTINPENSSGQDSALLAGAGKLGKNLSESPLFDEVFYRLPPGYEFRLAMELSNHLPVLADKSDLRRFEQLMEPENMRRKLREDFLALNSPAGFAMRKQIQADPLGFVGVVLDKLTSLRGSLNLTVRDGFFVSDDGRHCLLWAESAVPLTSSENSILVKQRIDEAMSESLPDGIRARVIGPLPHTLANAMTIRSDLARLLPLAVVALLAFLLLFMRDWRAFLLLAMPFLAAPPAVALVSIIYGRISAMALGFGIVLLGIGIDFAVHIYIGAVSGSVRGEISGDLRKSLFMAFLTTLTVFGVLLLSRVPAQRQMAMLGIAGLSWAYFLAGQLVPSLAKWSRPGAGNLPFTAGIWKPRQDNRNRFIKLAIWLLLLIGGLSAWPSLTYNGDLRALDVPVSSVKNDERAFLEVWGGDNEQAFIVASGSERGKVLDINDRVYDLLVENGKTTGVQSLAVLLPGPVRQEDNLARWRDFRSARLPGFVKELQAAAVDSGFTPDAFQPFIDWLKREPERLGPDDLLEGPLRPFIHSLFRSSKPVKAFAGEGNRFLAATVVPDNETNRELFGRLERELEDVNVLSNSSWRRQVEEDLRSDILRLSTIAAFLVFIICAIFFRSLRPVVGVLAPVGSALAAMAIFAAFTGGELNIMHGLMGIMVIGLSVDYGIFVAGSCLSGVEDKTLFAVSICAVSTLSGFGVLAFAEHPALHALGATVLVGIGAAWPTALLVTPVLLGSSSNREDGC